MLFEVYKDNKRVMHTEYEECIPSIDQIKSMKAAGYKILLDGKVYKIPKEGNKVILSRPNPSNKTNAKEIGGT